MNFFEAIASGFRNYVGFSDRAIRSEYWYWTLFYILLIIVTSVIDFAILGASQYGPVTTITYLATFLPALAVSIRRLHDLDRTGWWVLLALIPLIGGIILLVWYCMRGTVGPNRFGPDPLQGKV
jgi:uncharacterized membrane protein YhaH (DUF805 family)